MSSIWDPYQDWSGSGYWTFSPETLNIKKCKKKKNHKPRLEIRHIGDALISNLGEWGLGVSVRNFKHIVDQSSLWIVLTITSVMSGLTKCNVFIRCVGLRRCHYNVKLQRYYTYKIVHDEITISGSSGGDTNIHF